ncbi:MAG: wax ester/triacylglycerol synthase family O-acyltransferase [Solirubrobacteraceae bacterium]
MSDTLTALDTAFLELEELDPGALMSIGGAMVFEPAGGGRAPDIAAVRGSLAPRLTQLPRYSQRLSGTRTRGLAWLHWQDDDRFDIANHVRRESLPRPGRARQLCDWTAEFFSHPLDRSRPLWELVLLEGLEQHRWAVGWKTHHCLVDGLGSVGVVGLMLDSDRAPDPAAGEVGQPDGRRSHHDRRAADVRWSRAPRPAEPVTQAVRAGARAADGGLHAVLHPREAFARSRALVQLLVRDELVGSPHTSLNVPIGSARRYDVVRASLADLKAIGRALGGSVNDVLLAACAAGLRKLLLERGEELPVQGLRAMVPMNLRDAAGRLALGNRVTSLFVDLPVAETDPRRRLAEIAATTRSLKDSGAARGVTTLLDLADLSSPAVLHAALAQTIFSTRLFNVTITNVPGWPQPMYAFGSVLREILPVVPLAAWHAVGIAIFSYNGRVTVGINADRNTVPDIETLTSGIDAALREMRAAAA